MQGIAQQPQSFLVCLLRHILSRTIFDYKVFFTVLFSMCGFLMLFGLFDCVWLVWLFFFTAYEHISSFLVTQKDKLDRQEKPEKRERHAGNNLISELVLNFEVSQN